MLSGEMVTHHKATIQVILPLCKEYGIVSDPESNYQAQLQYKYGGKTYDMTFHRKEGVDSIGAGKDMRLKCFIILNGNCYKELNFRVFLSQRIKSTIEETSFINLEEDKQFFTPLITSSSNVTSDFNFVKEQIISSPSFQPPIMVNYKLVKEGRESYTGQPPISFFYGKSSSICTYLVSNIDSEIVTTSKNHKFDNEDEDDLKVSICSLEMTPIKISDENGVKNLHYSILAKPSPSFDLNIFHVDKNKFHIRLVKTVRFRRTIGEQYIFQFFHVPSQTKTHIPVTLTALGKNYSTQPNLLLYTTEDGIHVKAIVNNSSSSSNNNNEKKSLPEKRKKLHFPSPIVNCSKKLFV